MATASDGTNAGAGAAGAGAAGAGAAAAGAGAADKGAAAATGTQAGAAAGADKGAAGAAAGLGAGAAGGEADKGAAGTQNAAAVPEFKLPDGFDAKDPAVGKIKELATGGKLNAEQTQLVADFLLKSPELKMLRDVEKLAQAHQAEVKGWVESLRADPDIGGAKLDASLKIANGALLKFGGPELNKLFIERGISDNPVLVKAWAAVGKAISEDSMAGSKGAPHKAGAPTDMKELAEKLYGAS